MRGISQDYDVEVQEWQDKLIERIPKPTADVSVKFVSLILVILAYIEYSYHSIDR